MRKILKYPLLLLLVSGFVGCSVQHMYIIRNFSKVPIEIILTINRPKDKSGVPDLAISSVSEIIQLKKSKLATSFVNKIPGSWNETGSCEFVVPPGYSVDLSNLIRQLSPGVITKTDFNGSKIEIKYGKSALLFGNNLAELHRIFKFKSFFWGGPFVYYLDLE